jgi:hypothetical protein
LKTDRRKSRCSHVRIVVREQGYGNITAHSINIKDPDFHSKSRQALQGALSHFVWVFSLKWRCGAEQKRRSRHSTFLRNEQPSVRRALPPVGWHNTVLQFPHSTTVCAWLKTVVLQRKKYSVRNRKVICHRQWPKRQEDAEQRQILTC